jgi:hypothetical protein
MTNYWLETGAVLTLAYMLLMLDAVFVFAAVKLHWGFVLLMPPIIALHFGVWGLWRSRPSIL